MSHRRTAASNQLACDPGSQSAKTRRGHALDERGAPIPTPSHALPRFSAFVRFRVSTGSHCDSSVKRLLLPSGVDTHVLQARTLATSRPKSDAPGSAIVDAAGSWVRTGDVRKPVFSNITTSCRMRTADQRPPTISSFGVAHTINMRLISGPVPLRHPA